MNFTDDLLCDPQDLDDLDPARTAHLCIDVQRYYFSEVPKESDLREEVLLDGRYATEARNTARNIARIKPLFNKAGLCKTIMIYHKPAGEEFFLVEPSGKEGDIVLPKDNFSAFDGTALDETLVDMGIRNLILTGGYTGQCVNTTACDGLEKGYNVFVLADCVFDIVDPDRFFYNASLKRSFTSCSEPVKEAHFTTGHRPVDPGRKCSEPVKEAHFTTAAAVLQKLKYAPDS